LFKYKKYRLSNIFLSNISDFLYPLFNYLILFIFLFFKNTTTLNDEINPSVPNILTSSPVFTLAVVSPLFTGVFTVLSTFDGALGLACNPAIAFSNTSFALSTSS